MRRMGGVAAAEDPFLHAVPLNHPWGGFEHSLPGRTEGSLRSESVCIPPAPDPAQYQVNRWCPMNVVKWTSQSPHEGSQRLAPARQLGICTA